MEIGEWYINPAQVACIGRHHGNSFVVYMAGGHECPCRFDTDAEAMEAWRALTMAIEAPGRYPK